MSYGVTPTGFVKKSLTEIVGEIKQAELDTIDKKLNLLATTVLGQLNGIIGDKLRELWDVLESVYRAAYPDSASFEALDQVLAITGVVRLSEEPSRVLLDRMYLDGGTTVPAGSIVSVGSDGDQYETIADVTNSETFAQTLSVEARAVLPGPRPAYAGTIDTIQTPVAGWSASPAISGTIAEPYNLDGKTLTLAANNELQFDVNFAAGDPWSAQDVADLIVTRATQFAQDATASDEDGKVRVASTLDGPGSAIEIVGGTAAAVLGLPVGKIEGFNSDDASYVGRYEETDEAARVRREELLEVAGAATVEAIRADIRRLDGVLQCLVLENTGIVVDGNGLPPKSFRAIVLGGDEDEIAEAIWLSKPAGIESDGSITRVVTDSMGFDHDVKFSRPTEVPIYIDATLTTDDDFPVDGVAQVKAALVALGQTLQITEDVIALQFKAEPLQVSGVVDVPVFEIDTANPPIGTSNIPIGITSIATFDTSRIRIPNP